MTKKEGPRRIKQREAAAGEQAKLATAIAGEQRVGVLDGVEVDFTHPELPAGEWEALPWWNVAGPPPNNAGILFPSEAAHRLSDDWREVKGSWADFPFVEVRAGDKITVESVLVKLEGGGFDHPHDRQVRLASLKVERPNGEVLRPDGPLGFYGTGRILQHGSREAFDHIVDRVLSHAGVEDFPPPIPDEVHVSLWSRPLEEIALFFTQEAHRSFFKLNDTLPPDGAGGLQRAHLRSLANAAALSGFLLAKLEARKPESAARGVMANRAKGTDAVRRDDWPDKASAIWAAHPEYRRTTVAKLVAEGTDDDERAIMRAIKSVDPHLKR